MAKEGQSTAFALPPSSNRRGILYLFGLGLVYGRTGSLAISAHFQTDFSTQACASVSGFCFLAKRSRPVFSSRAFGFRLVMARLPRRSRLSGEVRRRDPSPELSQPIPWLEAFFLPLLGTVAVVFLAYGRGCCPGSLRLGIYFCANCRFGSGLGLAFRIILDHGSQSLGEGVQQVFAFAKFFPHHRP